MTDHNGDTDKLDILTEQIGHLTEAVTQLSITVNTGFTELKVLVQKQSETADKQADTIKSLADSVAALVAKLTP
ncbi:hypothetical protein [Stenomitos frigidus]|uniref:Uncharacterized protein n=1 Tax=Stenomitos frigidus ULC18 TaxID=2107698 RepID=A0A2T1EAV1_9CYAN|nr:hypothetical protein [Stenomitos frigidus]PSB29882.1 hypothetical protein C7B82_10025 [Stenomitos frigidus ULC18]